LKKKKRFYLLSKVTLAVSKVRHLPHLPPLRYGHAVSDGLSHMYILVECVGISVFHYFTNPNKLNLFSKYFKMRK
jgi:hypothetical protein